MDFPLTSLVLAAVGGSVIALLLSVFGGGGSVLATPLLIYIVGVRDPHVAIGTSAAAVALNAAMSLATQAKAGRVKWPCALVFGGAGLAGSLVGAQFAKHVDGQQLLIWFALAMALVGASMLLARKDNGDPEVHLTAPLATRLAPLGLTVGVASGFFGIGGGFLIVPGLMSATGMTLANAAASSLVSVVLFGAATSVSYALSGLVNGEIFLALVVGGAMGALAGAPIARRVAAHATAGRRTFATLVLVTAGYVALRASGAWTG